MHNHENLRYCSLVPRSTIKPATGSFSGCMASNDSQAHLKFCFAKGACSLLNHVFTQPEKMGVLFPAPPFFFCIFSTVLSSIIET